MGTCSCWAELGTVCGCFCTTLGMLVLLVHAGCITGLWLCCDWYAAQGKKRALPQVDYTTVVWVTGVWAVPPFGATHRSGVPDLG